MIAKYVIRRQIATMCAAVAAVAAGALPTYAASEPTTPTTVLAAVRSTAAPAVAQIVASPRQPSVAANIAFVRGLDVTDSFENALLAGGTIPAYRRRADVPRGAAAAPADGYGDATLARLLNRAVALAVEQIHDCYDRVLLQTPGRNGTMVVRLDVGPAGTVTYVGIARDSLHDYRVGECVVRAFSALRTAAAVRDRVQAEIPLVFSADARR